MQVHHMTSVCLSVCVFDRQVPIRKNEICCILHTGFQEAYSRSSPCLALRWLGAEFHRVKWDGGASVLIVRRAFDELILEQGCIRHFHADLSHFPKSRKRKPRIPTTSSGTEALYMFPPPLVWPLGSYPNQRLLEARVPLHPRRRTPPQGRCAVRAGAAAAGRKPTCN